MTAIGFSPPVLKGGPTVSPLSDSFIFLLSPDTSFPEFYLKLILQVPLSLNYGSDFPEEVALGDPVRVCLLPSYVAET